MSTEIFAVNLCLRCEHHDHCYRYAFVTDGISKALCSDFELCNIDTVAAVAIKRQKGRVGMENATKYTAGHLAVSYANIHLAPDLCTRLVQNLDIHGCTGCYYQPLTSCEAPSDWKCCGREPHPYIEWTMPTPLTKEQKAWLEVMCDEVTADCVAEIAAAVSPGEVAIGFHRPDNYERWIMPPLVGEYQKTPVGVRFSRIILQPIEPAPLTGKAWAAKQACGTMFEIAGSWWLFVISIRNFMIIIRDGKCVGGQPCLVDGKWEDWPDCLDPVCDDHIIHRPPESD